MTSRHLLLPFSIAAIASIASIAAVATGCADKGAVDLAPSPLASGPRIAGAPPNLNPTGELGAVADFSASLHAPAVTTLSTVRDRVRQRGAVVGSINDQLGVPTLLWSNRPSDESDSIAAALSHVRAFRDIYGLSSGVIASAEVDRVHDTGRGAIVVNFVQSVAGVRVYGVSSSVVMDRDNTLIALTGHLHPSGLAHAVVPSLAIESGVAVDRVIDDLGAGAVRVLTERTTPVLYPHAKSLELALQVELEVAPANSTDSRAFIYVIAEDGRILERLNRTFSESFRYRVWADTVSPFRPLDGPQGDWSPHPTGEPIDLSPQFVAPSLVDVEAFNTNPAGGSDPWLAPNATVTSGNNVNAYADHVGPDGFGAGDIQADTTSNRTFDYVFDPTLDPFITDEQVKASIVQIFFTINWLHDFYYDSGFNESARVAQADNFGRGPGAGDALLAEAQDTRGEQRNNANMSTLGDGISPRMQMYVWNGPIEFIGETSLTITSPAAIAGNYTAQAASFGVDSEVSASGSLSISSPTNGCGAITNNVSGRIVVIDRGDCPFVEKAVNAAAAGAAAVVIVNNVGTNTLPPLGGNNNTLTVPVVGISSSDGQTIKGAIAAATVSGDASRAGRARGADRDGTVDNAIVAHEWGHYFHHRLSFCGGTQQCGAMSEGWGDFMSVQLLVREGDNLDGVYGVPSFVSSDPYFGIRRVPYSTRFDRNALTFKHIGESATLPTDQHPMFDFGANNEVHNAGEIWTTMLTEAYFALLSDERLTFTDAQRRFSDYLVAGLLATPANATFTEVRDSILAVAAASDKVDMLVLAQAFARRGAGTAALGPARSSETMNGVIESYDVAGDIAVGSLALPAAIDCDEDGNWDAGETASVRIEIANAGPLMLAGTTVEVSTDNPSVSFPDGSTVEIAALDGFGSGIAEVNVTLAEDVGPLEAVTFSVVATNASALTTEVSAELVRRVNFDDIAASSATDDVESQLVVWDALTDVESFAWTRSAAGASLNTVWKVADPSTTADVRLESPAFDVEDTLTIELEHRYSFEQSDGTSWDGGVIEISVDGGVSWQDVGAVAGYDGVLTDESGNPLGGRQAFTGQSPGYPNMTTKTLALGAAYAGQSVRVRFRVASDAGVGDEGWEIDNIAVSGIANTPFASIGDDIGSCDGIVGPPGGGDDGGGCGCQSSSQSGGGGGALLLAIALGLVARRRRRRRRR